MSRLLIPGMLLLTFLFAHATAVGQESNQLLRGSSLRIVEPNNRSEFSENGSMSGRNLESTDPIDSLDMPLQKPSTEDAQPRSFGGSLVSGMLPTVAGALAVTLGLFCIWAAVMRRGGIKTGGRSLPREALEIIGQTAVGPKEKILVLRCGMQAIVVGVTPAGMHTLAQFDDPDEAGQFIASCRGMNATRSFQNTIREMEREPVAPGFVDAGASPKRDATQSSGRLFLRA